MRYLAAAIILTACVQTTTVTCPDGRACPADTKCYTTADSTSLCLFPDQLTSCTALDDGLDCLIEMKTPGLCREHICLPAGCSDGFRRDPEQCDGEELGAASDCRELGYYYSAPLTCNDACSYDTSACTGECGDNLVDPGFELCDGAPPARSCSDLGYGAGFLECSMCGPGVDGCHLFGWDPAAITLSTVPAQFMNDVHGIDDGRVFAAGNGAALYQYDGANWSAVDLSSCSDSSFAASSVWTFDDAVLVGGSSGTVLRVTPAGCTSSVVDAAAQPVRDLWATSATDVYAVTASGVFHFDGTAWAVSSTMTGLSRLWGSGPDDVYAAGGSTLAHRTAATWGTVTVGGITSITALWGSSATDVYVGGLDGSPAVVRHYNGTTWISMPAPPTLTVAAGATSNGRVFVTGAVLGRAADVFDFDGATWIPLQWPTTAADATSLWFSKRGTLYGTVLDRARIYRFPGSMRVDEIISSDDVVRVSAHTSADAYAVTLDAVLPKGGALSVWDGSVWTQDGGGPSNPGTSSVVDVSAAPDGSVYLLETGVGLRRQTGPNTWTTGVASSADALWTAALNDVWLNTRNAGNSVLSHWNGTALTTCSSCTFTGTLVKDMSGTAPNNLYAVGEDALITHWNGTAWTTIPSPAPVGMWTAVATCGSTVVVGGSQGVIAHFDGTAWSLTNLPQPLTPTSLWCSGAKDVFASSTSGYLFWFDGVHWSPVKSGTSLTVQSVSGAGDTLFTSDQSGSLHRMIRTSPWLSPP